MKKTTLLIDLDRCIGCYSCEVACKNENNVELGIRYNKILTMGPVNKYPDTEMYFLPVVCQECKNAPCVEVCPTQASYINDKGIILVDKSKCIGCKSCMEACPYGARAFNKKSQVVEKCTLCDHLLNAGDKPACVKACCGRARISGDINDPTSEISQRIKAAGAENVHSMPDAGGNEPTIKYILHKKTASWQKRDQWQFFPEEN